MSRFRTLLLLICLLPPARPSRAEVLGVEDFGYADGLLAKRAGGVFWDWNQLERRHHGQASVWRVATGEPRVVSGRLHTADAFALRCFGGPSTGNPAGGSDEARGAIRAQGRVFVRCTATFPADLAWGGISLLNFQEETLFFGAFRPAPGQPAALGLETKAGERRRALAPLAITPGQPVRLVAGLDYDRELFQLWINPEGPQPAPAATLPWTGDQWTTAIRLASRGGTVQWDDLVVATQWEDLP